MYKCKCLEILQRDNQGNNIHWPCNATYICNAKQSNNKNKMKSLCHTVKPKSNFEMVYVNYVRISKSSWLKKRYRFLKQAPHTWSHCMNLYTPLLHAVSLCFKFLERKIQMTKISGNPEEETRHKEAKMWGHIPSKLGHSFKHPSSVASHIWQHGVALLRR